MKEGTKKTHPSNNSLLEVLQTTFDTLYTEQVRISLFLNIRMAVQFRCISVKNFIFQVYTKLKINNTPREYCCKNNKFSIENNR